MSFVATADTARRIDLRQHQEPLQLCNRSRSESLAFVNREREMAELRAGLADALAGRGRLFMLVGEAGIGKTCLAEALAAEAHEQEAHVLWGRCWEDEGTPAYWPWAQAIRFYLDDRQGSALSPQIRPAAVRTSAMLSRPSGRLPPMAARRPDQMPDRFHVFDEVTGLLRTAAAATPVVLILEDLHRADEASLALLQFFVRQTQDARVLVVGTYRDAEIRRRPTLSLALGELARDAHHITLQGLSLQAVARYIEILTGDAPAEWLAAAVYEKSDGNPFLVNEIVRLLLSRRSLDADHDALSYSIPIPPSVREDVIGTRVGRLSAKAGRLLSVAAVIGREFDASTLAHLCARGDGVCQAPRCTPSADPDCHGERMMRCLEEAVEAGLVTATDDGVGRHRFVHTIIREAIYEELPAAERIELHRAVGDALEELREPESQLLTLAHHFFRAAPGGAASKAIDYAIQAGEWCARTLRHEEAVRQYERALAVLDLATADEPKRCELLLALGEAQWHASLFRAAGETFRRAGEVARRSGAAEQFARAALGCGTGLVGVHVGQVDKDVVAALEEALSLLSEADSTLRVRLLGRLAEELYFSDARERRAWLSEQAVAMARRLGDPPTLMYALSCRRFAVWGPDNAEERLALATEAVELSQTAPDTELGAQAHVWRLTDHLDRCEIPAVDLEIETVGRLARDLRQPVLLWQAELARAMRALLDGRFEEAEQLAHQALATGKKARSRDAAHFFAVQMFALRREQGRLEELEAATKAFANQYAAVPAWRAALANLCARLGKRAEAERELEYLARNDFAHLPRDANWLVSMALLAEVCALLGDSCHAALLHSQLVPYAGFNATVAPAVASVGAVAHYAGLLAVTIGNTDNAAWKFERAIGINTIMGARPFLAHSQREYAALLLARRQPGDRERGLGLLDEALATYRRLGMDCSATTAAALRRDAGCDSERPVPMATAAPQVPLRQDGRSVTAGHDRTALQPVFPETAFHREGRYWAIAADGMTARLKDTKGLQYLAQLVRQPGREIHVTELVTALGNAPRDAGADRMNRAELVRQDLRVGWLTDAGPVLDDRARAQYRGRIAELREEEEGAERSNDPVRAATARAEREFIATQLAAACGFHGRARKSTDVVEKVRKAVTNRVKDSLAKIAEAHPDLGEHLAQSVKTGTFCSYNPAKSPS